MKMGVYLPPLTLLLQQFDGDAADRALLDTLHQVGHVSENLKMVIPPFIKSTFSDQLLKHFYNT